MPEVEQKGGAAAEPIRHPAERRRADEHADESRRDHRRQRDATEVELLRQDGSENAGQEDVEEVKNDPMPAMMVAIR